MLQRLLTKLKTPQSKTASAQQFEMGVLKKSPNYHKDGKLSKSRCKCEPAACICGKKKQQQQSLLLSQLRRRGADNLSSVILF